MLEEKLNSPLTLAGPPRLESATLSERLRRLRGWRNNPFPWLITTPFNKSKRLHFSAGTNPHYQFRRGKELSPLIINTFFLKGGNPHTINLGVRTSSPHLINTSGGAINGGVLSRGRDYGWKPHRVAARLERSLSRASMYWRAREKQRGAVSVKLRFRAAL